MKTFFDLAMFLNEAVANTRILAIDFGKKKLGFSLSDRDRIIATPYKQFDRCGKKQDLQHIKAIVLEHNVGGIVMGYPVAINGLASEQCVEVEKFAELLADNLGLPIYLQDERFTTMAARQMLKETNLSWQKKNVIDDKIAATLILQTVLELIGKHQHS